MNLPIASIRIINSVRYDFGSIQTLAENIAEFGMLHPLVVNENYELIAGYRRLKAVELLGWTEVPVTIVSPADELKRFDTSLHENYQRKNLTPLEVCDAILERRYRWEKIHGPIRPGPKSQEAGSELELSANGTKFKLETAKILHTNETTIKRLLQLKELDADLKQQLEERKISYRTALSLQSDRKKDQKLKSKTNLHTPNLPDREYATGLQNEYNQSPLLFQVIIAVSHIYQIIGKTQGNLPEFDKTNPDRLVQLVGHLSAVIEWLTKLMNEIQTYLMSQLQDDVKQNLQ